MPEKKKSNSLIWAVVGVVVVVAAVVLCVVLFNNKGSSIKTLADFKTALVDKKAMNCTVTQPEGGDMVMQTTDGFKKVKLVMDGEVEGMEGKTYVLMIEGGSTYMWDEGKTMAFKTSDKSILDNFVSEIEEVEDEDEEDDAGYSFKCESADKADFAIPDDVDFLDIEDLFGGGFDYDDYYYDEEGDYYDN